MDRVSLAVALVVLLTVATGCRSQEGGACVDGDGQAGRCSLLSSCPSLTQRLEIPISSSTISFLRRSVCSFESGAVLMCCATTTAPTVTGTSLLPSSCGVTGLVDRIIDGEDAPLLAWPWMALFRGKEPFQPRSVWYCGGVLINDRYILTAAHCFDPTISPELEFVRLGEHTLTSNPDCQNNLCAPAPQDFEVEEVIEHPQYKSPCSQCNDIALVRLRTKVTVNPPFLTPICLPVDPLKDMGFPVEEFQGKFAWAAGWGSVSRNPNRPFQPSVLQQVLLPIQEESFCSTLRRGYPDSRSTLCAGGQGKDTCKGDSGGPLVLSNKEGTRRFVVGITSKGPKVCGRQNTQGLYTSIHHYVPWILQTLRP